MHFTASFPFRWSHFMQPLHIANQCFFCLSLALPLRADWSMMKLGTGQCEELPSWLLLLCSRGGWACLQCDVPHARRDHAIHHQRHGPLFLPSASGGVRRHRSVQFSCHDPPLDVSHGHGVWKYLPDETIRASAWSNYASCQVVSGLWCPWWNTEYHPWTTWRYLPLWTWHLIWLPKAKVLSQWWGVLGCFRDEGIY